MYFRRQRSQLPWPQRDRRGPSTRPLVACRHPGDQAPKTATKVRSFLGLAGYYRRYVKNFAAIAGPLHALTRKDTVFIGAPSARTPSTASKPSSPLAPSPPSPTSSYLSASTRTCQPQNSAQSSLKSGKARSASSAARLAPSTKRRRPTPLLNWNASPSFGLLRSSDRTSSPCPSRSTQTTMLCNGSKRCGRGPHFFTAAQPHWRSMISP